MRSLRWILVALLLLGPSTLRADVVLRIPVVTQIQGAVFYRTSVTIGNGTGSNPVNILLRLTYRSAADDTLQRVNITPGPLNPYRVLVYEDIIQTFRSAGVIRAADANEAIFGTLQVTFDANNQLLVDSIAEARTYSPANGGGTNGIAYIGRDINNAGSQRIKAAVRDGTFGTDGTTRCNIGFVNEGTVATDVHVTYRDGETGQILREFNETGLQPGEVIQLNNIFSTVPSTTETMIVRADALAGNGRISGYAVQLDSTTNDGAFFLFAEEEEACEYTPPG